MRCPACTLESPGTPKFCPSCGAAMVVAGAGEDEPRQASLVGTTIAGKYRIVKQLGEGGMGCVYVGEQTLGPTVRKVAIKTLHPHLAREEAIRARFAREGATLAGLEHPNTVQVFDSGTNEDGSLFLVMELVQGESLAAILDRDEVLDPPRVVAIIEQICGSLEEAHQKGIIHRDLKPDNIVLTERAGRKDFVKVLDFGIAKRSGQQHQNEAKLTQQGTVVGTPPYMSPEQFLGKELSPASDVYSLAVMAFEMLTGELPLRAESSFEWASAHLTQPPRHASTTARGATIPPAMADAIHRALSKAPEQRFASMAEFFDRFSGKSNPSAAEMARGRTTASMRPDAPVAKARTEIGEPLAFPPEAMAAGAAPLALALPTAPQAHGAAPYVAPAMAPPPAAVIPPAHTAPRGRAGKQGASTGLIAALAVAGVLSVGGIVYGLSGGSSTSSSTAAPLDLGAPPPATVAPAAADPTATAPSVAPQAPLDPGAPLVTPPPVSPAPQKPAAPQPGKPSPQPPAPQPPAPQPPSPQPPAPQPPAPQPPAPQPPAPQPPAPQPPAPKPPVPTPTPPAPAGEHPSCAKARQMKAANFPAVLIKRHEDDCRKAGGHP